VVPALRAARAATVSSLSVYSDAGDFIGQGAPRMAHPDGRYWGLPATHNRNSSHHRGHNFNKNQSIYRSHAERGWTGEVQLEAMDIEGIDVAVQHAVHVARYHGRADQARRD
jgi:hypothetical protein